MPAQAEQPSSKTSAAVRARAGTQHLHECRRLRTAILESEQSERRVRAAMMESVQQDLFILRKRFRRMNCQGSVRT